MFTKNKKENKLRIFVRVTKNKYMHNNQIVSNTKATLLKRMSRGSLQDLIIDPEYDITQINLDAYEEGVYELITTNHSYDIESGILDDWELTLIKAENQ